MFCLVCLSRSIINVTVNMTRYEVSANIRSVSILYMITVISLLGYFILLVEVEMKWIFFSFCSNFLHLKLIAEHRFKELVVAYGKDAIPEGDPNPKSQDERLRRHYHSTKAAGRIKLKS